MSKKIRATTKELEQKFEATAFNLNQERSDFLIPQILDFVKKRKWINLRPEYQRRLVWDVKKRSLFIESLLLNIPIPPLFLYERDLSRYEVMDGQQRINAVVEFFENGYPLKGLEKWRELNGLRYNELPEKLKRGLDRRRLSANVLLVQSGAFEVSKSNDIRKLVFERLNTGGQSLNAQELRNCLYDGYFNRMLVQAARSDTFCSIWGIPLYSENVDRAGNISSALAENPLYKRMQDTEIVLRYFALSNRSKIKGSVRSILDECMIERLDTSESEADEMMEYFEELLMTSRRIFGEHTFRYRDANGKWRLSQPLYDAVMNALNLLGNFDRLYSKRVAIRKSVEGLFADEDAFAVLVGRPNTAPAIRERLDLVTAAIAKGAGI